MIEQRINDDLNIRKSFWDLVIEIGYQCKSNEDKQKASKDLNENFDWCLLNEWHETPNGIKFTLEDAMSEWCEKH